MGRNEPHAGGYRGIQTWRGERAFSNPRRCNRPAHGFIPSIYLHAAKDPGYRGSTVEHQEAKLASPPIQPRGKHRLYLHLNRALVSRDMAPYQDSSDEPRLKGSWTGRAWLSFLVGSRRETHRRWGRKASPLVCAEGDVTSGCVKERGDMAETRYLVGELVEVRRRRGVSKAGRVLSERRWYWL